MKENYNYIKQTWFIYNNNIYIMFFNTLFYWNIPYLDIEEYEDETIFTCLKERYVLKPSKKKKDFVEGQTCIMCNTGKFIKKSNNKIIKYKEKTEILNNLTYLYCDNCKEGFYNLESTNRIDTLNAEIKDLPKGKK